jgi:hypothetical protein
MATIKKTPAKKIAPKKSAVKTTLVKKPSSEQTCWPGFEPTPGKAAGEKGSCKPKAKQTSSEKKGDAKAAAASKQGKAGGSKRKP